MTMVSEVNRRVLLVRGQASIPIGKGGIKAAVQVNLGFLDVLEEAAKLVDGARHADELVDSLLELPDFTHGLFQRVLDSQQA
jgi:hypothetical protein